MDTLMTKMKPLDPNGFTGLILKAPKPKDFIAGVNSPLVIGDIEPTGDWSPYVSTLEKQHLGNLETMNCTAFSYTNDIEDQINRMIIKKTIGVAAYKFLSDNGYLDDNGLVNFSERALGSMAGTTQNGNDLQTVCETARTKGLAPNKSWPWDPNIQNTYQSYYAKPPQAIYDIAKQFLTYFDLPYHWVGIGDPSAINSYPSNLKVAPLYSALVTCGGWNTPPVQWCGVSGCNHAVVLVKCDQNNNPKIQDSYDPYIKELALNYGIPYTLQVIALQKVVMPPLTGIKLATSPTVYVPMGNGVYVPLANWDAFVEIGGSSQTVSVVTPDQFASYTVVKDVFLKK